MHKQNNLQIKQILIKKKYNLQTIPVKKIDLK